MAASQAALAPARLDAAQPETAYLETALPGTAAPARADINLANAQHSTGPRSAEGKARSSQNALKYGLFASLLNLPPAEHAIYDLIAASIPHAEECNHLGVQAAAIEVAILMYRLDRVRRLEYSTYDERIKAICEAESITEPSDLAERGLLEARIFREDAAGPRTLARLHTHERFFTRQLELARSYYNDLINKHFPEPCVMPPAFEGYKQASKAFRVSPEETRAFVASFSENEQIPRSALCPCGSGEKYKRCCGRTAPPALHHGA